MLTDNELEHMAGQYIAADWTPDRYYRDMNIVAFARNVESAVLTRAAVPPSLVQQPTMPAPQFAQWAMAVLCAEDEPYKLVSLEGRTVLALRDALAAATQVEARLPRGRRPTDADLRDVWQSVVDALPAATDEDQRIAFARAVLSIRCAAL